MLAFREFLEDGEVLTYEIPREQDDGVVWSGIRLAERAILRLFKQKTGKERLTVRPWEAKEFALEATGDGQSYLLSKNGKIERV